MPPPLYLDSHNVFRSPVLDQFPWLEHGFGTRLSQGWPASAIVTVQQVHSDRVVLADGRSGKIGEGDALIAGEPGTVVAIRTADCLPVLVLDPARRKVAAIHAGWRGTVAGIGPKTIAMMQSLFGSVLPELLVVIGPGIGECCFEVGPEVARQFQPFFPERGDLEERTRISLADTLHRQLLNMGLKTGQVAVSDLCTCCHTGVFHSYRRDREASGRMVTAIGVRA